MLTQHAGHPCDDASRRLAVRQVEALSQDRARHMPVAIPADKVDLPNARRNPTTALAALLVKPSALLAGALAKADK